MSASPEQEGRYPDEVRSLDEAVAALEGQRGALGDRVVDTALAPLTAQRDRLVASATGEQRKHVTVLFADLVDSTRVTSRLDPEDMQQLLSRYFAAARAAVEAEGGVVKYIGTPSWPSSVCTGPARTTPRGRSGRRWPCGRRCSSRPPTRRPPTAPDCPSGSASTPARSSSRPWPVGAPASSSSWATPSTGRPVSSPPRLRARCCSRPRPRTRSAAASAFAGSAGWSSRGWAPRWTPSSSRVSRPTGAGGW